MSRLHQRMLTAMDINMIVLAALQLCVSISLAVLGIKALNRKKAEVLMKTNTSDHSQSKTVPISSICWMTSSSISSNNCRGCADSWTSVCSAGTTLLKNMKFSKQNEFSQRLFVALSLYETLRCSVSAGWRRCQDLPAPADQSPHDQSWCLTSIHPNTKLYENES